MYLFPEAKYAEAQIDSRDPEIRVWLTFPNDRRELVVMHADHMANSLDKVRKAQAKYPRKPKDYCAALDKPVEGR